MTLRSAAWAGFLAVFLACGGHLLFGREDLNLADEGFLHYGMVRTLAGEVPLRDFQSYEPGRYYWCAAWSGIFGEGFLGMRRSLALFQGIGLFFGLLFARRALGSAWPLPFVGLILWAWMFPRHKMFEPSFAMTCAFGLLCLLERPSPRRHLACGALVGLAVFFGRNIALYTGLGTVLLAALLAWKGRGSMDRAGLLRRLGALVLGGLAGASPLIAMVLFVPGFAAAFLESILFFAERGSNLPRPYLWPWRFERLTPDTFGVACAYLLPVVTYATGILTGLLSRPGDLARRAPLIAASFVGLFFAHHASVRSDALHLAQSIHPALLGFVALGSSLWPGRRALLGPAGAAFLLVITFLATRSTSPLLRLHFGERRQPLIAYEVLGDELRVVPAFRAYMEELRRVVESHVPTEEPLFVAQAFPGLYSFFGKVSPVWRIYFLWHGETGEQEEMVRAIDEKGVDHVLIIEMPVDSRRDLLFRNSHAVLWKHFQERFERVPTPTLPAVNHFLFHRRAP